MEERRGRKNGKREKEKGGRGKEKGGRVEKEIVEGIGRKGGGLEEIREIVREGGGMGIIGIFPL